MRRWRKIPVPEFDTDTVGPMSELRRGMLSFCVDSECDRGVMLFVPEGATILCESEHSARGIRAAGSDPILVDDAAGEFWYLLTAASADVGTLPPIAGYGAVIDQTARIGSRAFKLFRGELMPSLGGVSIGDGSTIGAYTCVDAGIYGEYTEVGSGVHIDNLVHVGHSVVIGDGTSIAANSTLGGWCRIGSNCRIETSVTVFQSVTIGDGTRVGSGSVVTRDLPPGVVAYGNPARIVRDR